MIPAIGDKVMVRSNEDEPLKVGTLNGVEMINKSVIGFVNLDGKEYAVMGFIIPYDEKLFNFLNTMNYKEQFNLLRSIRNYQDDLEILAFNSTFKRFR